MYKVILPIYLLGIAIHLFYLFQSRRQPLDTGAGVIIASLFWPIFWIVIASATLFGALFNLGEDSDVEGT